MYYPQQLTKLTRLADDPGLDSLATINNGALLALLKRHCALPSDSSWTEADAMLAMYLDVAEAWVDEVTGCSYRGHAYTLDLQALSNTAISTLPRGISSYWLGLPIARFSAIRFPVFPVTVPLTSFGWTDNDGTTGTFTEGTDFVVEGALTRAPELIMLPNVEWPETGLVPYPFRISFQAGSSSRPELQKMAILQYASYLYRNPEGMGQEVPNMGQAFWGIISLLSGTYL